MRYLIIAVIVIGLLAPAAPADSAIVSVASAEQTYLPLEGDIMNPERGLYAGIDLVNETELGWFRDQGYTLAHAYIRLDDYRNSAIPQTFLDDVSRGLDAARAAGIKIIFRASYNFGIGEDDAPKSRVLHHISQFQPIFEQHEDVIAVVQAGFIGAWGEWHSSTNGLTDPAAKAEIRDALLAAVPDTRMVQFRYLPDIEDWSAAPLTASTAYDKSDLARTAHHNDCFLATDDDAGTYWPGVITDHKAYLEAASTFLAIGGETCQVGFDDFQERRSCSVARQELAQFHWGYLNEDWHEPTLQIWKDQGCFDEISKQLGYRYRLVSSRLPQQVSAGGAIAGDITIANDGYGTLFNERPVYVVLDGPTRVDFELDTDPRRWTAGTTTSVAFADVVPDTLATGTYTLALWMPDAADSLQNRTDYAVQMANESVWDEVSGYNVLGEISVVAATACASGVGSRFVDVGADSVFCGDVEWLATVGITKGCNPPANDRFCPSQPITRGQMAAFLHRGFPDLTTGATPAFTDTLGNTFAADIAWLGAAGITKGCNPPVNDQFCPSQQVTRGQMAAFLHRAIEDRLQPGSPVSFIDVADSVFGESVAWLGATGISKGCNPPVNDQFCPTQSVTRGQMAAFLHRALDLS